jgi:hypothetical protein
MPGWTTVVEASQFPAAGSIPTERHELPLVTTSLLDAASPRRLISVGAVASGGGASILNGGQIFGDRGRLPKGYPKRLLYRHAKGLTTWGAIFVYCYCNVSMIFELYWQVALYFFTVLF